MSRKYIGKIDKDRNFHPASANWEKWRVKRDAPLVISKNWLKWEEKRKEISDGRNPDYVFNIRSDDQLRWLLYDQLGYEPIEFTDGDLPSVSSKVLPIYGDIGKLLVEFNELEKEQSYMADYLERLEREGRDTLHPGFQLPGTLTGRISGKNPNLMQMPKTKRCMNIFISRPGYSFVDFDYAALEPHVGAELSGDRNLLALYGPGSPKHQDIYLFYGAQVPGEIGDTIRATGYDPFNPTKDTIDRAKKECKKLRGLMKGMILSDTYGSGVSKKQQILRNQGIDMPLARVQTVHDALQAAKDGVLRYTGELREEWRSTERNGVGYIMSGVGTPIGLHKKKLKDLWNSQCQDTGHKILVMYANAVGSALDARGIEWYPVIQDWHDAITVEVRDEDIERTEQIMLDVAKQINERLGGTVPLKGVPEHGKTLTAVKQPEN
jgi:hypothetical protein